MRVTAAALWLGVLAASLAPAARANLATTATVDTDARALPSVAPSFMGISHEWPNVEEIATQPKYIDMLKYLGSFGGGPVSIRVGGGSTDLQDFVPPKAVWESMAKVHAATGAKFIIGVNLNASRGGDPSLAVRQMQAAKDNMPASAIEHFEIGNEPNFFLEGRSKSWSGEWRDVAGEEYIECCFWTDWKNTAKAMAAPATTANFAGPAWGHVNVRTSTINWFLNENSNFTGLVTVHWYKATKETEVTPETLLDEAPIRKEAENLRRLVQVSKGWGKPLRVAEMNTISNSGRDGVSNVMSAALWTLDALFEVAAAGSVGVNLHQGAGQNLYAALIRWYNDADPTEYRPVGIRPPFYGMALFQMATGGGAQLLPVEMSATGGVKVWPMWVASKNELRFLVINKRAADVENVTLGIKRAAGFGDATVTRLVAAGVARPLEAKSGITLGGQYWDDASELKGARASERVARGYAGGKLMWRVRMPPGSAALLVIPAATN